MTFRERELIMVMRSFWRNVMGISTTIMTCNKCVVTMRNAKKRVTFLAAGESSVLAKGYCGPTLLDND